MKKLIYAFPAALLLLGTLTGPLEGRAPSRSSAAAKVAQDIAFGERSLLNINNMALWFKRDGWSARNPLNDNAGVDFPRSTDHVIFQDGLIWGGRVLDGDPQELRVGGQTYEIGTVPGRILSRGVADDPGDPGVRIYRVRRDYRTADLRLDASELLNKGLSEVTEDDLEALRNQYDLNWREWPAHWGAPFYDRDGDGVYTPQFDADGNPDPAADEPGLANADQVAWFVINDLDAGATTSLYGSKPIGLEVQVTLWGYARTDALGDVIFKKYSVIYKGTESTPDDAVIEDMYFAQWSDPDLGDYGDDFAGCDVELSLGYVYNSIDSDSHYRAFNLAPPAVGYDFLQGPIVPVPQKDENGEIVTDDEGNPVLDESVEAIFNFGKRPGYRNLPMTSFVYFAAGSAISDPELGEYQGTQQWYNLLRGYQPQPDVDNPVPYTNPLTNEATLFTLDGDPTRALGWNDGNPLPAGDRRIVLNTGPFEMVLGDTQEVVVALLGGISSDRLRSISKLKFTDQFVQDAYNNFFEVPSPPAAPQVRVTELDRAVLLDWGWNPEGISATEEVSSSGFVFEGYNLYQLPSAEATLDQGTKLATYDLENGVTTILGIDLDEASGIVLDVPKQIGSDFGIKRYVKLTRDVLRGRPLVNGQRYYFAVTAYNRNTAEGAAVTTLESPPQVFVTVPQPPPMGKRYLTEAEEVIEADHSAGVSDGSVRAVVVNPTLTTGDDYEVSFAQDDEGATTWSLRNTSAGIPLLTGQADQTGAGFYIGTDGIEVAVSGPPNGMKDWEIPSGERWWTWAEAFFGAEGFNGAMTGDPNHNWFEPSTVTAADLRTVEIRFTSVVEAEGENQYKPVDPNNENVSWAYRYLRGAGADPPGAGDLTTVAEAARYDWSKYIVNTEGPGIYVYQDRVPIALSAWDIESDPPRRLEVGFLENNLPGGLVNGAYGPAWYSTASNVAGGGPREWLFIFDADYTQPGEDTPALTDYGLLPMNSQDAGEPVIPLMWAIFAARRVEDRFPQDGDSFLLVANHVNTVADVFSFMVPGSAESAEYRKEDLKKINVFPNPYFGVNEAETSRYSHFITFSYLPARATIRIFDLGGTLVRTLEKDDADPYLRWDLNNDNELPIASGMYIAHIEMPGINKSKILKLAIVQEQQFLENY